MHDIRICTIIPVYNGERYIDRCLSNIFNQKVDNLYVIVVNDGSTDNTKNILNKWTTHDNLTVVNINNGGVSRARNIGMSLAKEYSDDMTYLIFQDIDDELVEGSFAALKECIKRHNYPDTIVYGYRSVLYDAMGKQIRENVVVPKQCALLNRDEIISDYFEYYGIETGLRNPVWNKCFKLKILNDVLFREEMRQAEDLFFCIDVLKKTNTMYLLPEVHYVYNRIVDENRSYNNIDIETALARNLSIRKMIIDIGVDETKAKEEYHRQVYSTIYDFCITAIRTKPLMWKQLVIHYLSCLQKIDNPVPFRNLSFSQKIMWVAKKIPAQGLRLIFMKVASDAIVMIRK